MADKQTQKPAPTEAPRPKRDKQGRGEYRVTEKAGSWVAGRRSPGKDKTLWLTDAQAEHALRTGEIKPA